jgi:hypothetical protein
MGDVDEPARTWQTNVANVAVQSDFYTFKDDDGVAHREIESFFGQIESLATPVLARILDDPRYALLEDWPLDPESRIRLAWFIAAQIVRTTRQRKRIAVDTDPGLSFPGQMRDSDLATDHARYIVRMVGVIAYVLHLRPWGLGHSGACLVTSDCPVVLLDYHDAENQIMAVTLSDIVFPLDPHRLIFMPGPHLVEEDPRKASDHLIKFDGIGAAFTQAVYDAADKYFFAHPNHAPVLDLRKHGRLPAPGEPDRGHGYAISYGPMRPGFTIEKRWASEHPPQATPN